MVWLELIILMITALFAAGAFFFAWKNRSPENNSMRDDLKRVEQACNEGARRKSYRRQNGTERTFPEFHGIQYKIIDGIRAESVRREPEEPTGNSCHAGTDSAVQ